MYPKFNRVILIVLDSVGVGALPDADRYGDEGSNTLAHIGEALGGLNLPNLESLGLGSIVAIKGVKPAKRPLASFGKMAEQSPGKDTTTGHWEMMGIILNHPFPTYPKGFPPDVMAKFEEISGRGTLGNKVASGTEIINELGDEHLRSGKLIVYTSADSVFQIAAHEEVVPLEELYDICTKARAILKPPHLVARVIARPFIGSNGRYIRTANRHDYSALPPSKTLLNILSDKGIPVIGIGKIGDIFAGSGLSKSYRTGSNQGGIAKLLSLMDEEPDGLIFINLVDFDMLYGHRNDPVGYYKALKEFDECLPKIFGKLGDDDLLIITADHGCDPTFRGTDHTREYVPLIAYSKKGGGVNLGVRESLADVAATIAANFNIDGTGKGNSFLDSL
ncbi:MAG: phosphopentomutase [Nitrospinota bacterium]